MKEPINQLPFSFSFLNLRKLLLIVVACFYLIVFGVWIRNGIFPLSYGGDYLGYWSAGKVSDSIGYSEIYNPNNLRSVQEHELVEIGVLNETDELSPLLIPGIPYLSFFVLPFQLLSKFELQISYWLWTTFNIILLIGYLFFFVRKIKPKESSHSFGNKMLLLVLLSYPVFINLVEGQVNIFLMVFVGEFLRAALYKKPVLAGLWLGSLLLKPQLLILIIPILLIKRNWKVMMGFFASSGSIIIFSFILSGNAGMKALIKIWTGFGDSNSVLNPGAMINWRMVGFNLNSFMNNSNGWVITGLGTILTLMAVYYSVKHAPTFGSPEWAVIMLGVFSATLAILWHAHAHTALILIPFLVYASLYKLQHEVLIYLWVAVTPLAWLFIIIAGAVTLYLMKIDIFIYQRMIIAFSGFILNQAILIFTIQFSYHRSLQKM